MINIYLDIDGVLLTKNLKPANYAFEFLQYVLSNYPFSTYWLTTRCQGDAGTSTVGGVKKSPVSDNSSGFYHGNINSKVFHGSGCQHYNCKNCTVRFVSVSEAISAGYRGHRDCVK